VPPKENRPSGFGVLLFRPLFRCLAFNGGGPKMIPITVPTHFGEKKGKPCFVCSFFLFLFVSVFFCGRGGPARRRHRFYIRDDPSVDGVGHRKE